jgi:transcriptional regulator with XRE-family HTH domain
LNEYKQPQVGNRIRELREQRALSLRALAEQCGLSINAISRIERDESSPTVASLHRLAGALSVPITTFFDAGDAQSTVYVRRDRRMRTQGRGITMDSLGSGLTAQQMEPFLMTLGPGVISAAEPISHSGEEFVFCQEGTIEYQVGEEKYRLETGDTLLFQASQPHVCRNIGDGPATILLVLQAAPDVASSRRHHLDL